MTMVAAFRGDLRSAMMFELRSYSDGTVRFMPPSHTLPLPDVAHAKTHTEPLPLGLAHNRSTNQL